MNYLPACIPDIRTWCNSPIVQPHPKLNSVIAATPHTCPAQLASLTTLLVRDLPGYTNRLTQQRRNRTDKLYSSIVTASVPELEPIETISHEYPARFPQTAPTQVFISTLERQYTDIQSAQLQQFHWLFLTQTRLGWRLANIYSRTGGFPIANNSISPPTESSKTVVGEAIRVWLNDCHLGRIRE